MKATANKQIEEKQPKKDIHLLDPRLINVIEGFNDRLDYGNIDELVQSIREEGILQPVLGYKDDGKYYLIAGHRRLKAALILLEEGTFVRVPFSSGKKTSTEDMLIKSFLSNAGKGFNPIEESSLINRLLKHGLKPSEIASRLGRTPSHISSMGKLASLPVKLKNSIASNDITSTLVLEIMRATKNLSVDELANQIEIIIKEKSLDGDNKKITKKDIDKKSGKTNSFSAIKKALKLSDRRVIKEENRALFDLFKKINDGQYTFEQIMNEIYEPFEADQK